jgi:hypothetical protein
LFIVDYTITRTSGGCQRGRRRVPYEPATGRSLLLAGMRVRVEQVEDLRTRPGKPDFVVHGRELTK